MAERLIITELIDEENEIRPVIVQFQNSTLREGEEKKLQTSVFRKSASKRIVTAATKEILYKGTINRTGDEGNVTNKFLVLKNKKTGDVRLVAVDIATLTPQLSQKRHDVVDKSAKADSSIDKLNKEFGSKKIKRITEQRERLKMDIEDAKEQLEKTVAAVETEGMESFTMRSDENDSLYKPPINRGASTKEEVYVLDEIVPENVLSSLEEEANYVLSEDLDQLSLSPFIKEPLTQLQSSSNPNRIKKCELLLYLNYLIIYINKPAKNITKKCVICESSQEVNNHILDNFSVLTNSGRARPLSIRDKAVCYILVLSMIAFDYQLDLEALTKNVKMGIKKLLEMGRILAFSQHGKNKTTMVLKIPLPSALTFSPKKRRK